MKDIVFSGSCVALITPFKDGKVDKESLVKLLEFQLKNKTDAILVLGTTGEPATMTHDEKIEVMKIAGDVVKGRAKLIIGAGSNCTQTAIENCLEAKRYGADAVLVVTPYYNKCTQNGIVEHYKAIAKEVDIPIIAYNVPGRTGVNILPQTALKLSEIPQLVGIKEASGNISQIVNLCNLVCDKMAVYSGDDSLNYVFMTLGAKGAISVTANVLPNEVKKVITLCEQKEYDLAKQQHNKLLEINQNMFVEVNPIPVKYATKILGLSNGEVRLPLTELEDNNKSLVEKSLNKVIGK